LLQFAARARRKLSLCQCLPRLLAGLDAPGQTDLVVLGEEGVLPDVIEVKAERILVRCPSPSPRTGTCHRTLSAPELSFALERSDGSRRLRSLP
jgi:hypothetical protein